MEINSNYSSPNSGLVDGPTSPNLLSGWDRVAMAIQRVRQRLHRTAAALESAAVPYAVIGGNAVAEWVGRIDEGAVRFTRDVDILIRREDLPAVTDAMLAAGFAHNRTMNVDMFLDGPDSKPSEAVHLIFANENVKENDLHPTPDIQDSEFQGQFRVVSLEALVGMKLTSFRDKDRTHLRDMLGVGLIDASWLEKLPAVLAERFATILNTPED